MRELFIKTEKSFIASLPRFTFGGKIVVVQGEYEAERAVAALRRCPLLGIDTETRPSFRKGCVNPVALLQVSDADICFLFRLNIFGFSPALISLMGDENVRKVGLSLKDDFHMLSLRHQFTPRACIDLQDIVKSMGLQDLSLQKLCANVFHQRLSKSARLTNWQADVLSESQRMYAATDAYACIRLYEELTRLQASGDYTLIPFPKEDKKDESV